MWKTLQAIGTRAEPKRRGIYDAQNLYWRQSQLGKKAKQWEYVFCVVFDLELIEILQECAKDQLKERREHLIVQDIH